MCLGEDDFGFNQRRSRDGIFDLICMQWFQIVAVAVEERDLEQFEHEHVCAPEGCPFSVRAGNEKGQD